jgi:hypothetical protein
LIRHDAPSELFSSRAVDFDIGVRHRGMSKPTPISVTVSKVIEAPAETRMIQRRNGVTDRAAHLHSAMTVTLDRLAASATH